MSEDVEVEKTLEEWREVYEGVQGLLSEPLPFKQAYWVARSADRIERIVKNIETARKKLLEEFCDRDDKGEMVITPNPGGGGVTYKVMQRAVEFNKALRELMEQTDRVRLFLVDPLDFGEKIQFISAGVLKGAMALFKKPN